MNPAKKTTPADFGVWEVAYKVSETDFNMKRSLAKAAAPLSGDLRELAHATGDLQCTICRR